MERDYVGEDTRACGVDEDVVKDWRGGGEGKEYE